MVLGSFLSAGAVNGHPQHTEAPVRLTVSVFNDARVERGVLRDAQTRAELVMKQTGIDLMWLDCGTPGQWARSEMGCNEIAFPAHLSVRLVANTKPSSMDALGESFIDRKGEGNYANVYIAPLAESKVLGALTEGELIGYVVAHELGHLLLGKDSHGVAGLMRAVWQAPEVEQALRGTLFFTAPERERIRRRYVLAAARLNAAGMRAASGK